MSVFAGNLLSMASRLTGTQTILWYKWIGQQKTKVGIVNAKYAEGKKIPALVQAVTRSMYETLGLDMQKEYVIVYTSTPLQDLARDATPDRFDYNNRRYDVESNNADWIAQNGWTGALGVDIGSAI